MRIRLIVFLFVTLATWWHPVMSRPADDSGAALWNTCSSNDGCQTTAVATPTSHTTTAASYDPWMSPAATPIEDQGIPPAGSSSQPQAVGYPILDDPSYTYGANSITIQLGVTGGLLIAFGLYLMILGFRFFRPTLALTGFLKLGLVTWIGLINAKPAHGYVNDAVTMIAVPAGVGVLGAIIYAYFWYISYYLVGAMGGFTFGVFILLWREDLVIVNDIGRYSFLGGLALVCAGLTKFQERHVVLKSTAFTGAFIFIVGIDCLAHVGYLSGIIKLLDRNTHHTQGAYEIGGRTYGMMVGIILLSLVSFGWQFVINLGRKFGVNGGILARLLHHHQQEQHEESGGSSPSPQSGSEHQAKTDHHTEHNLLDEVVHHIGEALEAHVKQ